MENDHKNKLIVGIFIFIVSMYFAVFVHETGHAIAYLFIGCKVPAPLVSPILIGMTFCDNPSDFEHPAFSDLLPKEQQAQMLIGGIPFVSVIGMILFLFYKSSNFLKKYYSLALIFYFFAFGCLLNGFFQSIRSGDVRLLVSEYGMNKLYFNILAIVNGLFLIYQISEFKNLLKIVEPSIKKENIRKMYILFLTPIFIFLIIYFFLPYLI